MRTSAALLLCAHVLGACSPESPMPSSLPTWGMTDTPVVSIGALEGDSAYLFQRIATARWAGADQIVVADAGASIIRVFDDTGVFVRQFGRRGEGPGEFLSLRDVWLAGGDTLGVWDSAAKRLTYFDLNDGTVRTAPITPGDDPSGTNLDLMAGVFSDGTVAIGALSFGDADRTGADRVTVELFASDGQHISRIGETTGMVREGRSPLPFSPFIYFAVRDDVVYATNGWLPQVHEWSRTGTRELTFPSTSHDNAAAWSALGEEVRERGEEFWLRQLEEASAPDTIPQLAGLVVDSEGLIWSKQYDPSTDALWLGGGTRVRGGEWWVVDPDSGPVAVVTLPDGVMPLEIRRDRILGLHIDAFGVERVVVHALERGNDVE